MSHKKMNYVKWYPYRNKVIRIQSRRKNTFFGRISMSWKNNECTSQQSTERVKVYPGILLVYFLSLMSIEKDFHHTTVSIWTFVPFVLPFFTAIVCTNFQHLLLYSRSPDFMAFKLIYYLAHRKKRENKFMVYTCIEIERIRNAVVLTHTHTPT